MTAPPLLPYLVEVEGRESGSEEESGRSFHWKGILAAQDPIYAGHFPGRPILPAIAQLELVRAASSLAVGRPLALTRIDVLKLRKTVEPGSGILLEIRPSAVEEASDDQRFAFQLTAEGGPAVSSGTVGLSPAAALVGPSARRAIEMTPIPTASRLSGAEPDLLLPHAPPALFLAGGAELFEGGLACSAIVPVEHALAADGTAPSFAALEAGAQAAGLLEALGRREDGEGRPAVGYIVGLRGVTLDSRPIAAGRPFRVVVRRSGGAGALAIYEVEAEVEAETGGRPLLRGTISAFLPGATGDEGT